MAEYRSESAGRKCSGRPLLDPNQPLPFDPEFLQKPPTSRERTNARRPASRRGPRRAIGAPGYLSVGRAAEVLGLQPRSVIYLLAVGRLTSQRLGRAHFLPAAEVERYRRLRRERAQRARLNRSGSGRIKLIR